MSRSSFHRVIPAVLAGLVTESSSFTPVATAPYRPLERVLWIKTTDPDLAVPTADPDVDIRVLLSTSPELDRLAARLTDASVPHRRVRYFLEQERISTATAPRLEPGYSQHVSPGQREPTVMDREVIGDAMDAFRAQWDMQDLPDLDAPHIPATRFIPPDWLPLLPYPTLNPAQAQVIPHILGSDRSLLFVAPTGAGKTVVGIVAALAALRDGRRAAWLVPQRSLTEELNRDLGSWRRHGLKIEQLSGETATDLAKIRAADLWVATTEKFEALCRTASLREAIAEVGTIVVDEIHLLGDPTRGSTLEALLARIRGTKSPVRIVGLSATVANADDVADWLGAQLIRTTWRPTQLTWQAPRFPASHDRKSTDAHRNALTVQITEAVCADDGSALVFCGTKKNVRLTALAIARSRGQHTQGVDADDTPAVHEICSRAGVVLHYSDWPHKRQAEKAFRARQASVMVATSTVAAGVNLPARAVIVRDTRIGIGDLGVSTVQQMFGRAGRLGAGEREGWAFLLTDDREHAPWIGRLAAGYTVTSSLLQTLPDHLLAETVQGRLTTLRDTESWYLQTLAYHQGAHDLSLLSEALTTLVDSELLTSTAGFEGGDLDLAPTPLGELTSRMMIPVADAYELRRQLALLTRPTSADGAELSIIRTLSRAVTAFADQPLPEEQRPTVSRVLQARGHVSRLGRARAHNRPPGLGARPVGGEELTQAALLLAANSPNCYLGRPKAVGGLPYSLLWPTLTETPRYLAWLGAQGYLDTIDPWVAVVAADLARRVRWLSLAPRRGAGRLLWMLEELATKPHADDVVPQLWAATQRRRIVAPDWPAGPRPHGTVLDDGHYRTLCADRAAGTVFSPGEGSPLVITHAPPGSRVSAIVADEPTVTEITAPNGSAVLLPAAQTSDARDVSAAVFTRRGDILPYGGWLADYAAV